jgi:hypothetical protein
MFCQPGAEVLDLLCRAFSLNRALLQATDELKADAFISDGTWTVLSRHYDTQALMDIVSSDCGGLLPPGSSAPPTGSEPASADHGVASVVRDQSAPQSVNVPV